MAKTLKAAVGHEFKQPLSIEEVPEVGPGQILVKIDLRVGMVGGATDNALLFRR
jgi:D-arabinose 1-dehydrogenase-like Zn-dependent alcohol dehydrogenase